MIMEERNLGFFLTMDFVLLIALIGLIFIIFDLTGTFLAAQLFFAVLLIILAFIALVGIYYNMRWGRVFITLVFSLVVLDELFIYILNRSFGTIFLVSFIAGLIGLLIAIANIRYRKGKKEALPQEKLEAIEKVEGHKLKTKYLASKTGKGYHSPDCIFAKKISKDNQVWLKDKEDAGSKGYKPHNCVKG